MHAPLPLTGTARLLEELSPFVPDQFINTILAAPPAHGPRPAFSAAQLWRVHLLAALTPVHSFNALVEFLPEQRDWRRFARLRHRWRTPDVRMLHEFRARAGVAGLRRINEHLVKALLALVPAETTTVAIIDATDLPASCAEKKKTKATGRRTARHWARVRSKPDIRGFLSVTRNTVCGCGCAPTLPRYS